MTHELHTAQRTRVVEEALPISRRRRSARRARGPLGRSARRQTRASTTGRRSEASRSRPRPPARHRNTGAVSFPCARTLFMSGYDAEKQGRADPALTAAAAKAAERLRPQLRPRFRRGM
eukprot:7379352-Prymnesium_polylepis.2